MRYDQGVSVHTGITGNVGTTFADNVYQRLRIDNNGDMIIGTGSPSSAYKVDIVGAMRASQLITASSGISASGGTFSGTQTFVNGATFSGRASFTAGICASGGTFSGTQTFVNGATFSGRASFTAGICASGGVTLSGQLTGVSASFSGLIISTAGFSGTGITLSGNLSAATKSFLIPHPSKPEKKLQYACLEGPENGVYVRGRLTGTNVIDLPDYWVNLVHEDSLTVQLTSFGEYKNYFVKSIQGNKVTIGPRSKDTDCFYLVQGERKDVPRLKVEY
jgi:hypothetical protein